jgi:hypothetical protein
MGLLSSGFAKGRFDGKPELLTTLLLHGCLKILTGHKDCKKIPISFQLVVSLYIYNIDLCWFIRVLKHGDNIVSHVSTIYQPPWPSEKNPF